jgi:hypothetical protein
MDEYAMITGIGNTKRYELGKRCRFREVALLFLADSPMGVKEIPPTLFHVLPHRFQL